MVFINFKQKDSTTDTSVRFVQGRFAWQDKGLVWGAWQDNAWHALQVSCHRAGKVQGPGAKIALPGMLPGVNVPA